MDGASQVAQWVKNLPAMQKTPEIRFRFLGQEDPLEEGTATPLACLPGESHGQRSLEGCSQQRKEPAMTKAPERSAGKWTQSSH